MECNCYRSVLAFPHVFFTLSSCFVYIPSTFHSTGITQQVYEAALMLQERLENLLAPFTVHLADRIERARVTNAELQEQMSIAKAKRDAEEAEAKKFEQLVCVMSEVVVMYVQLQVGFISNCFELY